MQVTPRKDATRNRDDDDRTRRDQEDRNRTVGGAKLHTHTDTKEDDHTGTGSRARKDDRVTYTNALITTLNRDPKTLEHFFHTTSDLADVSIDNKAWNTATEWTHEHAVTAAVVCQKIYDWVNWEDSPKPKQFVCYRAWFPIDSLKQMIEEACSHIRDPPTARRSTPPAARRSGSPWSMGR